MWDMEPGPSDQNSAQSPKSVPVSERDMKEGMSGMRSCSLAGGQEGLRLVNCSGWSRTWSWVGTGLFMCWAWCMEAVHPTSEEPQRTDDSDRPSAPHCNKGPLVARDAGVSLRSVLAWNMAQVGSKPPAELLSPSAAGLIPNCHLLAVGAWPRSHSPSRCPAKPLARALEGLPKGRSQGFRATPHMMVADGLSSEHTTCCMCAHPVAGTRAALLQLL